MIVVCQGAIVLFLYQEMRILKKIVDVVKTICAHSVSMTSLAEEVVFTKLLWLVVYCLISDGQQFKCSWLVSVCSKDNSCKKLYDDREQKCTSVFSWTEERRAPPMCTDECKEANAKLMKHKIWMGAGVCDCGDFDGNKTEREIRQTEQCYRSRRNMLLHCVGTFGDGGTCPKG